MLWEQWRGIAQCEGWGMLPWGNDSWAEPWRMVARSGWVISQGELRDKHLPSVSAPSTPTWWQASHLALLFLILLVISLHHVRSFCCCCQFQMLPFDLRGQEVRVWLTREHLPHPMTIIISIFSALVLVTWVTFPAPFFGVFYRHLKYIFIFN